MLDYWSWFKNKGFRMALDFLKEFGLENNPHFVSAKEFFSTLHDEERVFLLIRHSTRNLITPSDKDNGAHVALTEEGRAFAFSFGKLFPSGDATYFSSPVGRCIDTAKCIAEGRESVGGEASEVISLACLSEFYVKDFDLYKKNLNENFYSNICSWIESDNNPAFFPIHSRAEELKQFMYEKGTARFNIFSTHDAWVVPTLCHFCGFKFKPNCWMNYLTGIAFVKTPDSSERIVPITGMTNGYIKF